ncbi:hypothetical protein KJ912_01220, partial [Patescibacteria group bacterium]|nr:hypothetical protein [Patescibacteria group bacterium]
MIIKQKAKFQPKVNKRKLLVALFLFLILAIFFVIRKKEQPDLSQDLSTRQEENKNSDLADANNFSRQITEMQKQIKNLEKRINELEAIQSLELEESDEDPEDFEE